MATIRRIPIAVFLVLAAIAAIAALAPVDRILGSSARIAYLHGATVWAALLAFASAAVSGLAGFVLRRDELHRWSAGLGRAATAFWILSLLLSLASMQLSWNGLFFAEPRWGLGLRFGVTAVLLQVAAAVLGRPRFASFLNIVYFGALAFALAGVPSVMHPVSPVFTSDSVGIRLLFLALLAMVLAAAALLAKRLRPDA